MFAVTNEQGIELVVAGSSLQNNYSAPQGHPAYQLHAVWNK
jgi:hypothetical protein